MEDLYSLDVSLKGMFIPTTLATQDLPVGAVITLHLKAKGGLQDLRAVARVTGVVNGEPNSTQRSPGLEVEFIEVRPEHEHLISSLPPPPAIPNDAARILVVDDDNLMRENAAGVMRSVGYHVLTARNGVEALSLVLGERVDLVLTDVTMPSMDGWQLLRLIRARPRIAKLPVVFLTRLTSEAERLKGYELGVNDYIDKPYTAAELKQRVAKLLTRPLSEPPAELQVLRGDLSQVSLSSLLSLMEMERRSGQICLRRTAEEANAYVRAGVVVQVDLEDAFDHKHGLERIFHLLDWSDGEFKLFTSEVALEGDLNFSTSYALLEHAKVRDEAEEEVRAIGENSD